jgi:hypothetical protein
VNGLDRVKWIGEIALHLQATMRIHEINSFLGGYGIRELKPGVQPSKRVYVEEALVYAPAEQIRRMAVDLGLLESGFGSPTLEVAGRWLDEAGIDQAMDRIQQIVQSVDSQPEQAVTSIAGLLEAVFKTILDREGVDYKDSDALMPVARRAVGALQLSPDEYDDDRAKKVLGSLTNVIVGISEFRNKRSSAHGHSAARRPARLAPRHARLVVNSGAAVMVFVLETWHHRQSERSVLGSARDSSF